MEVRVEATLDVARNAKYSANDAESDASTYLTFIRRMIEDAGGSNDDVSTASFICLEAYVEDLE